MNLFKLNRQLNQLKLHAQVSGRPAHSHAQRSNVNKRQSAKLDSKTTRNICSLPELVEQSAEWRGKLDKEKELSYH